MKFLPAADQVRLILLFLASFSAGSLFGQAGSMGPSASPELAMLLDHNQQGSTRMDGIPVAPEVAPEGLILIPDSIETLVWVELEVGQLHLLQKNLADDQWQIVFTRPISIGKEGYGKLLEGDNRTPVGLYRFTSFITDEELIDFYGNGAFPINYPNSWDRLQGRTGYGIWLHGLPKNVGERPLLDSEGCVVIDNLALDWLRAYIQPGQTRLMLSDRIRWTSPAQVELARTEIMDQFEAWRSAWSAIDNNSYLGFYAEDFQSPDMQLGDWIAYKTRVNGQKNLDRCAGFRHRYLSLSWRKRHARYRVRSGLPQQQLQCTGAQTTFLETSDRRILEDRLRRRRVNDQKLLPDGDTSRHFFVICADTQLVSVR